MQTTDRPVTLLILLPITPLSPSTLPVPHLKQVHIALERLVLVV